MFVDTAKVNLKAGKGGDGAVSFRHEIYIPKGGPDGGDGGRGGSIIFRADKDTNTLLDFRYNPILTAEDGKNGSGQRSAGRSGKDLIVEVPIGTVVYKREEDARILIADLAKDGAEAIIAKGGDGGFGNAHFKSSVRQTPKIAEIGEPGEEFEAELELKLLADVGLVGLPNAGKSTFLSVVSNAKPEIADYPFTTITPNLGVATIDGQDILIADIPGLIEGASEGKGLGHDFLRHVDRTAVLLHLIDAYSDDAGAAYVTIRRELERYANLAQKPEIIALTKIEGLDPDIIKMQVDSIKSQFNLMRSQDSPAKSQDNLAKSQQLNEPKIYTISSVAHQGIEELLRALKAKVVANTTKNNEADNELEKNAINISTTSSQDALNSADNTDNSNANNYSIPVIALSDKELKDSWTVEKQTDKFIVRGEKIEKFARRTDLSNYASVNRLRDIMKKMGIRAELTSQGAVEDSIVSIAGKEFTLVEDW